MKATLGIDDERELILLDMALEGFVQTMKLSTMTIDVILKDKEKIKDVPYNEEQLKDNLQESNELVAIGEGLLEKIRDIDIPDKTVGEYELEKPDWLKWEEGNST